jgi:hypothetical protein
MRTIKSMRIGITVAAVLLVATVSVRAEMFAVKVKFTGYTRDNAGTGLAHVSLSGVQLISSCTNAPGAQLAAIVDDATSNITAVVTVDTCGNIFCTNLTITTSCDQVGVSSNGKTLTGLSATHVQYSAPGAGLTGDGFLLEKGTANPTNSAAVTAYTAKGVINLCTGSGAIISGTITVSGPIKIGKNCP